MEKFSEIQILCAGDLTEKLDHWHDYLVYEKRLSDHTIRAYIGDMVGFLKFMAVHIGHDLSIQILSDLKVRDFRSWISYLAEQNMQAVSRARALSCLKNFFKWMDWQGHMHNPTIQQFQSPKLPHKLPKALSERQAKSVLEFSAEHPHQNWVAARDQALFTLLYGAGLRIEEALGLICRDIPDYQDHFVGDTNYVFTVHGKGDKDRQVPVLPIILRYIHEYLALCPYPVEAERFVFLGVRGGKLHQGVAQKAMRIIRNSYDLPETATPHALRHSFATHLLNNGANIREIQELLGHASLSTTQRYTDLDHRALLTIHQKNHPRNQSNLMDDTSLGDENDAV